MRAEWRRHPRHAPIIPPRGPQDLADWHRILEREWARLFTLDVERPV